MANAFIGKGGYKYQHHDHRIIIKKQEAMRTIGKHLARKTIILTQDGKNRIPNQLEENDVINVKRSELQVLYL